MSLKKKVGTISDIRPHMLETLAESRLPVVVYGARKIATAAVELFRSRGLPDVLMTICSRYRFT